LEKGRRSLEQKKTTKAVETPAKQRREAAAQSGVAKSDEEEPLRDGKTCESLAKSELKAPDRYT